MAASRTSGGTDAARDWRGGRCSRDQRGRRSAGRRCICRWRQSGPEGAELVVRTQLPPEALAGSVMTTLRQINPGQPATEFRPLRSTGGSFGFAAAVLRAAGGDLCRAGSAAGGAGNLWRDRVFGHAADAGDRHPHGAGSEPGTGAERGAGKDAAAGAAAAWRRGSWS